MRQAQDTHDDVIIEMMYVLLTSVFALVGVLVAVVLTGWVLSLHSTAWQHVGQVILGLAALVVLSRAVFLLSRQPAPHPLD
jgi:hypothetical protein